MHGARDNSFHESSCYLLLNCMDKVTLKCQMWRELGTMPEQTKRENQRVCTLTAQLLHVVSLPKQLPDPPAWRASSDSSVQSLALASLLITLPRGIPLVSLHLRVIAVWPTLGREGQDQVLACNHWRWPVYTSHCRGGGVPLVFSPFTSNSSMTNTNIRNNRQTTGLRQFHCCFVCWR